MLARTEGPEEAEALLNRISDSGTAIILVGSPRDDLVEISLNGRPAGTCLWPPYAVDVSELLATGENVLELTVANTLANLLSGAERPSGLAGPPRLVSYSRWEAK